MSVVLLPLLFPLFRYRNGTITMTKEQLRVFPVSGFMLMHFSTHAVKAQLEHLL